MYSVANILKEKQKNNFNAYNTKINKIWMKILPCGFLGPHNIPPIPLIYKHLYKSYFVVQFKLKGNYQ